MEQHLSMPDLMKNDLSITKVALKRVSGQIELMTYIKPNYTREKGKRLDIE